MWRRRRGADGNDVAYPHAGRGRDSFSAPERNDTNIEWPETEQAS